ncbi:serine protease inhibitor [Streptomyces sp. G5(2025)]|uniref:serine protease inhibitor n=1 Tax=Streptomyces sp. G5(2025) TaxID=3406628 RepID=UPI003C1B57F6
MTVQLVDRFPAMRKILLTAVMAASTAVLLVPTAATAASETAPAVALAPAAPCEGKQAWPELVGIDANTAGYTIRKENPSVTVQIILAGSPVSPGFRCDRVRVFVNPQNVVVEMPRVG